MKGFHFDEKATIRVISYLLAYRDACDTNRIRQSAAIWKFKYTVTGMVRQNLSSRMYRPGTGTAKMRLTTYAQVENGLYRPMQPKPTPLARI